MAVAGTRAQVSRSPRVYRWCLRLLPRATRERHGDEMTRVFADVSAAARREGGLGLLRLWIVEAGGLIAFATRARFGDGSRELSWAWRGVRHRGWSAALGIGLLAAAIAGNAIVFAVADSLVFHRVTFHDPDGLVEIQNTGAPYQSSRMSADLIEAWAANTDLLAGLTGYLSKTIFLQGSGPAEIVAAADVTPGTFEMLGARPIWGRVFVPEDARTSGVDVVVISEALARARFGDARAAVGRRLDTTDLPLQIVGVMPGSFRFPTGATRIWRALDPRGELVKGFAGLATLARLSPGLPKAAAEPIVRQRGAAVAAAAGYSQPYAASLTPFQGAVASDVYRRVFLVLMGAAGCLLLIACANVASLELAAAIRHAGTYAIQLALGASRGVLARIALLEGVLLVGAAGALAAWLAVLGTRIVTASLPRQFVAGTMNPIDLDARAVAFMTATAGVCWILSSLPAVLYAWRASAIDLIKLDGRSQSISAGGVGLRQALTVSQIAAAVLLLAGALLYARSYLAMLRVEKGFDSRALAYMDFTIPPQRFAGVPGLREDLIERLEQVPGVVAVVDDPPPNGGNTPFSMREFEVDGKALTGQDFVLAQQDVSPDYFQALGIPIKAGRPFTPDESRRVAAANDPFAQRSRSEGARVPVVTRPGASRSPAIVDEAFARRFWPDGAVGHTFRGGFGGSVFEIVGVTGHVRTDGVARRRTSREPYLFYTPRSRRPPAPAAAGATRGGGWSGLLQLTIRLSSASRAEGVFSAARAMAPQFQMEGKLVDDAYAEYESDTWLMTRTIAAFGLLAFLVAMAGVYGVMAFIVAGRRREIGIRMTLGADRGAIGRLILGSSIRLALIGAGLGVSGAAAASRGVQSQLYGVSPTDPSTYGVVALLVVATAVLATLQPLRQAWRLDPAVTLRTE